MVYLVIGAIDKRACRLYEVSGMCLIFSSDGKFILSAGSPDPRLQLILIVKPFLIITYKISIFNSLIDMLYIPYLLRGITEVFLI